MKYDILVIGGGHAGCEAALAAARMGCSVLLFNINLDSLALMSCNPAIGGLAKGQLVKEIDALGGQMGIIADRTAVHCRLLNVSKGPAVQSTRFQCDRQLYRLAMKEVLERQKNLHLRQGLVESILVEGGRVSGVVDQLGIVYSAPSVIIATGTFLHGLIHIGANRLPGGRAGEAAADGLASCLARLGLETGRMKTGTPPRLHASTIDFSRMERQDSDSRVTPFSHRTVNLPEERIPSYFTYTTAETHGLIQDNIHCSPLYSGMIKGIGARYCPSLEDKVVRFADKERHPVVLEIEGLRTEEVYAKGLGNSLPPELQEKIVRSVPGLEEARIMRYGYAIEYDFVQPTQLRRTLETKAIAGLYLAGQINGTSGYEEAAAQGLWAGINAACAVQGRPAFVLQRFDAYMGVMVDDLVTKGVDEPYRMFTSRAEYRLLVREDNAALRLMERGFELGLIDRVCIDDLRRQKEAIKAQLEHLKTTKISPSPELNERLSRLGGAPLKNSASFYQILKRPEVTYDQMEGIPGWEAIADERVKKQIEITAKYEGYIDRQLSEVEKMRRLEEKTIPRGFDYLSVPGLSNELGAKLSRLEPLTIGQASRIPGMTQAGLTALLVAMKLQEKERDGG